MNKAEQVLCDYMVKFFDEHFHLIRYDLTDASLPTTKKEFLTLIGSDVQLAMWALQELAAWGMDKRNYLSELMAFQADDFFVLKIEDTYVRVSWKGYDYVLKECQPKTKTVIYFD